ncbi:MAG TPA: protein kinase [Pirellulaceae bacterium]|jgi:serine/threonine-protein kinase|nr:protein kinase [Pirellulaceae bacterium]
MAESVRSSNPLRSAGSDRPAANADERAGGSTEFSKTPPLAGTSDRESPSTDDSTASRYVVHGADSAKASESDDDAYVFGGDSSVQEDAPTVIRTDGLASEAPHDDDEPTHHGGSAFQAIERRLAPFAVQYLVGETLSHFRLDEFVGGGGMGCVFRATDLTLGRTVAVKVLSARGRDSDLLARFRNEAQNAARLDHENIARVYFVGADKGWNFIVFEFIEGINLREVVEREGPLALDRALDFVLQICDALEHAAGRDVVHRDIKPSNVLITPLGRAKLVDMGLARLQQIETPAGDLTASGVTLGTFDYISPEQARDPRFADVRSDIYSLGCTLFYVLTGEPPFAEGSGLQKLLRHTSDHPPDPRDVRPDLPERLTKIVWKALAKSPQDRYQTPSEFAGDLALLAEEMGFADALQGRTLVVATAPPPTALARLAVLGAALAILVLSMLVADVYLLPRSTPEVPVMPVLAKGPAVDARASEIPNPLDVPPTSTPADPAGSSEAVTPAVPTLSAGAPNLASAPDAGTPSIAGPAITEVTGSGARAVSAASAGPLASALAVPTESMPRFMGFPIDANQGAYAASYGPEQSMRVDVRSVRGSTAEPPAAMELSVGGEDASFAYSASDASPARSTVAAATVDAERLIVGDQSEFVTSSDRFVPDLETAVRLMERSHSVRTLELRFHGWRSCPPIRLLNQNVSIVAGSGYRPGLLLAPSDAGSQAPAIDLRNVDLTLENVELRWELSLDAADDLALIEARGGTRVRIAGSCVTISNLNDLGAPAPRGAAFFRVVSQAPASVPGETVVIPSPSFDFTGAVFRGEATLFRAIAGASFSCRWTNGLLASSERLLMAGGRIRRPLWDDLIEISLDQVTAIVPEGLVAFEATADAGPYFPLARIAVRDSIVKTLKSAPLIEHRGAVDLVEARSSIVSYYGRGDFYPETEIVWQVVPLAGPVQTFDLEGIRSVEWFDVTAPRRQALWYRRPQVPVSQQTPEDYRLLEDPTNPAYWGSDESGPVGADWTTLPTPLLPPARASMPSGISDASMP